MRHTNFDRDELIRAVHAATSKDTNVTMDGTGFVVKAVFAELLTGLMRDGGAQVKNFGTIKLRVAAPISRKSAPASFARGEWLNIPARARINVKLSPDVQQRMNDLIQTKPEWSKQ